MTLHVLAHIFDVVQKRSVYDSRELQDKRDFSSQLLIHVLDLHPCRILNLMEHLGQA